MPTRLVGSTGTPSTLTDTFGSWRPQAVVFDCDGLLMDTESLWVQTQRIVCGELGVYFDTNLQHQLVGLPASRIGPLMAERSGTDPDAVITQLLDVNERLVRESGKPMPGARELVTFLGAKVPLAVASNSARRILDVALSRGDFDNGFAATVSSDDVPRPKPAPDVYLAAANALGVGPQNCLAFEDSEAGAAAAGAAGMKVIAVPQTASQRPLAHALCDSLESEELLAWVAAWP
ncbi:HAD family phosphatase [Arthrobacter sp. FW305-123]|nr:HAD family phosphatase [Arthrobacter sp. FW305-123]